MPRRRSGCVIGRPNAVSASSRPGGDGHDRIAVPDTRTGAGRGTGDGHRRGQRGWIHSAAWLEALVEAMEAGLDLVAGMHARLRTSPCRQTAAATGASPCRRPPAARGSPDGERSSAHGKRLLTMGTDCALGKKYTALAMDAGVHRARNRRDVPRNGPDRHPHRGARHSHRCGRVRFRRRRRRIPLAGCRTVAIGTSSKARDRCSSGLRRCLARLVAWQPARRARGLP